MKKLGLFITICLLASSIMAQKANFILKGRVVDQNNVPIPRAKVLNQSDTSLSALTDQNGIFALYSENAIRRITIRSKGFVAKTVNVGSSTFIEVALLTGIEHIEVSEEPANYDMESVSTVQRKVSTSRLMQKDMSNGTFGGMSTPQPFNTESYSPINENDFHHVKDEPLSTFSIDVDRASYSNIRRFLNNGQLPPHDAVRIEEMVNYFNYDYTEPKDDDPVAVYSSITTAPWNTSNRLLHIGIKAKELETESLPASNMVFLIDVSGSMNAHNKLPLLKSAMNMLVGELRDDDRVAIVVYAGAAGLVLEPTPGYDKAKIKAAIEQLNAGGSTAGGAGIKLAYKVAKEAFIEEGNNRIILATDGDFNIGASSDGEMQRLIEENRDHGVFLTVLGFGLGNYKDSKMEILADKGNGNYAYIDNLTEARKTLVQEFGATMYTVAKDVKIQIEFNPTHVAEYRLVGYENRLLNNQDFNDDLKDAGEMGSGHVVTALYEIIPSTSESESRVDPLKYSKVISPAQPIQVFSDELATVKLRYKEPRGNASKLLTHTVDVKSEAFDEADLNIRWSASVASFGMLLRNSQYKGNMSYDKLIDIARQAIGEDVEGYRRECLQMMRNANGLAGNTAQK